ncbi:MAG: hypothetical protein MZU95_07140 [Desulfomicrobium escambiense]|nr:hypothetical protein [Desulfomicrobium escambiense]
MSQEAIQKAQGKAEELGHQEIRAEHLLWSFLARDENVVNALLAKIGAPAERIQSDLDAALARLPKVSGEGDGPVVRAAPDPRRGPQGGGTAQGRVRLDRAPVPGHAQGRPERGRRASCARRASRKKPSSRPWPPSAARSASPTPSPRASTRSSRSTPAT